MQYSAEIVSQAGINDTTLTIQREGEATVRLDSSIGLIFLSFVIDPPTPRTSTNDLPGTDGTQGGETTYGPRGMIARFWLIADDKYKYAAAEAKIIRLFDSKYYFKLVDEDRPDLQWENVKLSDKITFDRKGTAISEVTIPMVSYYPYTLYTGLLSDLANELGYPSGASMRSFTSTTFSLYNMGDTTIDPRVHDMVITFKGASDGLIIENLTTGDTWTYTDSTEATDEIKLDTVFAYKGALSIFDKTDHGLITLAPGENQIKISNSTGDMQIDFEFPTYRF
ncbi:MAG: phage tail domain-containing protein [Sporolactobacillus sp.]